MSDLSFNIVALDRASQTFVKVAEQAERLADKLDKIDGKTATAEVNVKTDKATQSLSSFGGQFNVLAAAIIAASPAAGAAIIGGIGAGFVGVAAMAQKNNVEVQASFRSMSQGVLLSTKQATDQLVPQFVGAGNKIAAEAQRLDPLLRQAFSATGPIVVALTSTVTDFAHNAMPGVTSAMTSSLPVFVGIQSAVGTIGSAFGDAVASVGQHSQQYGTVVSSLGSITGSVITNATSIVNSLGSVWAQNATQISGAVSGVTGDLAGLATGVLPILAGTLGVAATAVHVIAGALGPLAPVLGFVAAAAGATWVAFKVAGVVSSGISSLASGVLNLGVGMETAGAKSATMIAGMRGVAVESSVAATTVKAAGASAATATLGFATAASALAGPLSIALIAGTVLLGLFSSGEDKAKISTDDLKAANDTLTSALQSTHGAFNQQATDALKSTEEFKKTAEVTGKAGVSQTDLIAAVVEGGPKLEALRSRLDGVATSHTTMSQQVTAGRSGLQQSHKVIDDTGKAALTASSSLNTLAGTVQGSVQSQRDAASAAKNVADNLFSINTVGATTSPAMDAASAAAVRLGIPLNVVAQGFRSVVATGQGVATDVPGIAAKFTELSINVEAAGDAIQSHFAQVDKAVVTAKSSVSDAARSYQQSMTSITDAQHSAAQSATAVVAAEQGVVDAARGVTSAKVAQHDAIVGVTTAQASYVRAQKSELDAQLAINVAREQAITDLKAMHLQLEDATLSEETARLRLFEQHQSAKTFGVTDSNVKNVAAETVTWSNIDKVKAAQDLLSAQNALNNALNSGANLRKDVAAADALGVDKAKGVVTAETALVSAHDQVVSAADAVTKAQQQVETANYSLEQANRGLTRAQQGVTDAAYAEKRAHDAVRDAQYQSAAAATRLRDAKDALGTAERAASRSVDISTEAGRQNLTMLNDLDAAINARFGPTTEGYRAKVDMVAGAFNMSRDAAIQFLQNQEKIPRDFRYDVTAVANVDTASLQQVFKGTSAGGYFNDSMNQKRGIGTTGLAAGGPVSGPGGPRDDMIPIMASDGEYMQPAHIVDYYGVGFMEDVRNKKIPKGYANGGAISMNALGAGTGAAYMSTVNAQTMMGLPHPAQLPKWAPPAVVAYGGGAPGGGGVIPTGQHLALIDQALAFLGIPNGQWPAWEAGLNTLITRESGWNPNIVNTWDCVPLSTLILTRRGWLKHDEVRVGDETIGYNQATGRSKWTRITRVVHHSDAPLVRLENSRWHATTTPNHRWINLPRRNVPVETLPDTCHLCEWPEGTRRRGNTTNGGLRIHLSKAHSIKGEGPSGVYTTEAEFVTTEDIRSSARILLSAPAETASSLDVTVKEAAILGWIAGDGHVEKRQHRPTMSIAQSKPSMVDKIKALLVGVPHVVYIDDRGGCGPRHQFRLGYEYAQDLVQRAGNPKTRAVEQVLSMSTEQRDAWLEAMIDAEGHRSNGSVAAIYQAPGCVLEAITLAVYLSGRRPRVAHSKRIGDRGWAPEASVRPNNPVITGSFLSRVDAGRADVWCVTTELGTWTAREDDHVFLTGNSNAAAGHPSGGLMQTIASTFAGNRDPRLPNSMFDPLANVVAGINYINRTYGGIGNVQQANPNAPARGYADGGAVSGRAKPKGFDSGGWINPGDRGENHLGQPEAVLTPRESEAYVSQAKAAATGQGNAFVGKLYLESGALLGEFKAYSRAAELAAGPF